MHTPFDFWLENKKNKEIDIKIFYFSLEDSSSQVMKYLISNALYIKKNIRMSSMKLNSYFEEDKLDNETLRNVEDLGDYFETFLSKVEIIDNIRTPNGILNVVKEYLLRPDIGTFIKPNGERINRNEARDCIKNKIPISYSSKHPNRFVILLIDNLQNVEKDEQDVNKYAALDRLTRVVLRNKLCNYYKTCNYFVQQQAGSKESQQFTTSGTSIVEKLYPSVDGLGEFKNSVQTAHVCYGLFNPSRYKIDRISTEGGNFYDILKLGDRYRSLRILKSNYAESNMELSLYFDGLTEDWQELPSAGDTILMEKFYQKANPFNFSVKEKASLF